MKKFLTLFMATVIALSASALPLNIKKEKSQVKQPTELSLEKQARMEKMAAQLGTPALERQSADKKAVAKKTLPAAAKNAPKVKVAEQEEEVIELTYDDFAFGPVYYEDTYDWTIILSTNDEYSPAYGLMFQLDWFAPADNCYGTFTTEDFSMDDTFLNTPYSMGSILFSEIEMTLAAEKVSENLEVITLEATLRGGTDGFDTYPTYKISVKKENIVAKSYVDISIEDATLEENEMGFVVAGKNEDIDFAVAVANAYGIVGDYTNMSAFDLENTKMTYNGKEISPIRLTMGVELGESATGDLAYINTISWLGNDTVQYNIYAVAPLPAPTDTVEITCANLLVDDSYTSLFGTVDLQASNEDYVLYGAWYAAYIEEGTYSGADATLTLNPQNTDEYIEIKSLTATITVSLDDEGRWAVEATMLGSDNVWYVLHLSYHIPTPTDTVVVEFANSAKARFYPNFNNDLMLFNENEQYYAALDVAGINIGDTFTEENMDMMFTGLQKYDAEYDMLQPVEIATIKNGLLEQVGDTTKMQAEIFTFEGILYQVKLWHIPAVPTEEVTVEYDNVQFVNNLDYGYYNLLAYGPDSLTAMLITIYAYSEDYMAGTFVNDGVFGKFGEGQYDIDGSNSYFGVWSDDSYSYELSYMDKGEVTVVVDEENNITLTGSIICENAVKYNVTMHSKYEKPRLDYDSDCCPVERTFTAADQVALQSEYGITLLQVLSTENMDVLVLPFFISEEDPDIVIPEGTYEINDYWADGTVLASTGIDYEGNPQPSLYATMYEWDGQYYYDQFYFMVGGTVDVSKNEDNTIRIEINAVNSYDIPIHIVYDASQNNEGGATQVVVENATASEEGQNIVLNGMWGESDVTINLWQGGATQGYGNYSGEGEGDYYGWMMNPFVQLFPAGDGVYTDNGNGTWTFSATMTDGAVNYEVTMNGLIGGTGDIEIADYITIENTNIIKEGIFSNFVGYNDYYEVDLILFGQEYGVYEATEDEETGELIYPIEGMLNGNPFVGAGEYSFNEELNSDHLVAIVYVAADDLFYQITMYTKQAVVTDVLFMENMTKEIIEGRWNTNLQLSGVHEEYGDVVITIAGCDGTYGEYNVTAVVGDLELEGYGAWQNHGEVDMLNAMLQNADASRVFNVGVSTPYVDAPEPEVIIVEVEDAIFTETEDGLEIIGTSYEGQELYLLIGDWANTGYGWYTEFGAVIGSVDGVEVTIMGEDQYAAIEQDEDRAIFAAVLTDGTNIYEISAYGAAPTPTGLDNIFNSTTPVKMIENNQLIIIRDGVKYNAQGAVIK